MATRSLLGALVLNRWQKYKRSLALRFVFCKTAHGRPNENKLFVRCTVGRMLETTGFVCPRRPALLTAPINWCEQHRPNSVDLSWPLVDWVRDQVHIQSKARHCSSTEDLDICEAQDYVSCHTVKMRKRVNRRSGGWLVACDGRGMVLAASEFYAGESLTQRAAFVASVVDQFPTVTTVVHDDACHLRKFIEPWTGKQRIFLCARSFWCAMHAWRKGQEISWKKAFHMTAKPSSSRPVWPLKSKVLMVCIYSCYVTPQPGPIPSQTRGGFREADDPEDTDAPEYIFELPDGVESRFRYYLVDGHAVAHFRVPNRDILDNPQLSLQTCAESVTSRFSTPHTILELTEDARATFLGYQTLLNVKSNAAAQARRSLPHVQSPGGSKFTHRKLWYIYVIAMCWYNLSFTTPVFIVQLHATGPGCIPQATYPSLTWAQVTPRNPTDMFLPNTLLQNHPWRIWYTHTWSHTCARWKAMLPPRASASRLGIWECFLDYLRFLTCFWRRLLLRMTRSEDRLLTVADIT